MPTREQIERSRRRNRERGYTAEQVRRMAEPASRDPGERRRLSREAEAGPRWRHRLGQADGRYGPMFDAWDGPEPPAA